MMERLPPHPAQRIDRERELGFTYRGRPLKGLLGDTVATALFANGFRIFSRSLKFHRPRGLYDLEGYSTHCLMNVNGEPNVRACRRSLEPNMTVAAQNVLGSPQWDLLSILQWFHFAMPTGFYYKMFHKPAWIWPLAQRVLRRAAGLGRLEPGTPENVYGHRYLNAEVCIIGGGAAGMHAALAASDAGVRVILLESRGHLGGRLDFRRTSLKGGVPAYLHGNVLAREIESRENIRILISTHAMAIDQSNLVTAVQRGRVPEDVCERYYEIRARSVVVATGAVERPLVFQNNDCPGVMQGRCAQQLMHRYALKPGARAVVSGAHDGLLEVAADLADSGVTVAAVADARRDAIDEAALTRLERLGIPVYPGCTVTKAIQRRTLRGAVLGEPESGKALKLECDLLVASAGEVPLSQLLQSAGTPMAFDPITCWFLPTAFPQGLHAAGAVLGQARDEVIEAQGKVAGLSALQDVGLDVKSDLRGAQERLLSLPVPGPGWSGVDTSGRGYMRFVSFDEDVTVTQIEEAIAEGFDQTELVKRYTAAGTGPSQSYMTGYNLPLLVASKRGKNPGQVDPTTVRPPALPTSLAALAGRRHHPVKRTPLHAAQKSLGASFRIMGEWERARHFTDEQALDEVANVRNNVGFIDISTLGKFRVHGPDAIQLLQRVYVGDMSRVTEGKLTYSIMCNEEGVVVDDGVITQLGPSDYFFTTSTARAPHTSEWLRFHSRNENWDAHVVNLTDAMAAVNLAGPRARDVLERLTEQDVSNQALPFMGAERMTLCGDIEALVLRVGFVGELCYEIHVPSSRGRPLHDAILQAGEPLAIKPFGTEAQSVLRLEKGHVIIVVDTDNHTTLHEIGAGKHWARQKTDMNTVGAPALRFAEQQTHRQKLLGFVMEDTIAPPTDGSVVLDGGVVKGRVCSSRYSPTLKQALGMALVDTELVVMGASLEIYTDQRLSGNRLPKITTRKARIVPMPFYDPKGERVRA